MALPDRSCRRSFAAGIIAPLSLLIEIKAGLAVIGRISSGRDEEIEK
jgi:hypothetical protein